MSPVDGAGMYRWASTERDTTVSVIVVEFITLDGIVSDPDGSGGSPAGGWAFRHGPEAVAGDRSGSAACWMRESCCWAARPGRCSPGSGPGATIRSRPG